MRADRFGSYSIDATFAGMPILSRRKSIVRYFFWWPPPRCHIVTSPCALRPPVRFLDSVSDFSGVCFVISLLSSIVRKRRAGVYGLNVFSAIFTSYKFSAYSIIFSPPQFPVLNRGPHVIDLYLNTPLHGFLDFGLRGRVRHFEHHGVLRLFYPKAFFRNDRPSDNLKMLRRHN